MFCHECGSKFSAAYCGKCGASKMANAPALTASPADVKFCPGCGKGIHGAYCPGCGRSKGLIAQMGRQATVGIRPVAAASTGLTQWALMGVVFLYAVSMMNIFSALMLVAALVPACLALFMPDVYAKNKLALYAGGAGAGLLFAFLATFTGEVRLHVFGLVLCVLGLLVLVCIGAREMLAKQLPAGIASALTFIEGPMQFYITTGFFALATVFTRYVIPIPFWEVSHEFNLSPGRTFSLFVVTVLLVGPPVVLAYLLHHGMTGKIKIPLFAIGGTGILALFVIPLFIIRDLQFPVGLAWLGFVAVAGAGYILFTYKDVLFSMDNQRNISPMQPMQQPGMTPEILPPGTGTGFLQRLHSHGSSGTFLIGSVLFSAGTLLPILLNFSVFAIFSLALAVLPVIGVWLLYSASKTPKVPEGSLPGFTLFKVAAVIGLVFFCIALGITVIVMLLVLAGGAFLTDMFGGGGEIILLMLFIFAIVIALFILWLRFYYVALLRVLKSIREGILYGNCNEIRGVGSFTILSFISIGFGLLGDLSSLAMRTFIDGFLGEIQREILREVPPELRGFVSDLLPFGGFNPLPILLSIAGGVGLIMLLVVLRNFANEVKYSA
ncbi:MAG: hypothetical protein FWB88_05365 [Defluviitaleaceae bacterium]|nr:hypothetical protein [Defluviitaleaceae bacterium]MCL2239781.1 hypothetical protein [Defluviitaleaceae bacterium]